MKIACVSLSFAGMMATLQAQITPDIVASRTSGVAPLAVYFDATGTTAVGVDFPIHHLHYEWDFGDPGSGTWEISGISRNFASSPGAAHVFETPGTYVVTLYVTDGDNNATDTVTITVTDPNVVYAGTSTICFSNTGDFTGAPAGAQLVTTSFMSTVMNYKAANRRLLLKRGDTFTGGASMSGTGPTQLGAFGSGDALPRMQHGGTFFSGFGSDMRVTDLELEGGGTSDCRLATTSGNGDHILIMNTRVVPGTIHVGYSASTTNPPYPNGIFLVDNDWRDFGFGNGGNIVYVTAARIAILGNYFDDSTGGEHIIRIAHGERGVVSHNYLGKQARTKGVLTIRANDNQLTHDFFVTDNIFVNNSDIGVGFIGQNSSTQRPSGRDLIVERNFFTNTPENTSPVHVGLSIEHNEYKTNNYITIRNNIALDARITVDSGVNHVWLYNNSGYWPRAEHAYLISFGGSSGEGRFAANNLLYRPNAGSGTAVSGSNVTASNNLTETSVNPYITPDIDGPEDFRLHSTSVGIGAGIEVPNLLDYDLNSRLDRETWDVGAYRYQEDVDPGDPVPVTGVSLSPTSVNLSPGGSRQLVATISPLNATDQSLTWSSDNTSVATVNATGLASAVGLGNATITVTTDDGNFTATTEVAVTVQSVEITLNGDDGGGQSSFNTAGQWSDGQAPSSGNDYSNATTGRRLRSPATTGNYVFAGDSLTLSNEGLFFLKGAGTITIEDLRLNGGRVYYGVDAGGNLTLAGNISLDTGGGFLGATTAEYVSNQNFNVSAAIGGEGELWASLDAQWADFGVGPVRITLSGNNTYSGGTRVGGGSDAPNPGTRNYHLGGLELIVQSSLGTGDVIVEGHEVIAYTLNLQNSSAIHAEASLIISGSPGIALNFVGSSTIAGLSFDGGTTWTEPGIYGTETHPGLFSGTGTLTVGQVVEDEEGVVPYTTSAIVLDGLADAGYSTWASAFTGGGGELPEPANLSAAWRSAFDADNLYILVEITDDAWNTGNMVQDWYNDGVELFLDGSNLKGSHNQSGNYIKAAFIPLEDGTVWINTGVWPSNPPLDFSVVHAAYSLRKDGEDYKGYNLEIKVPLSLVGIMPEGGWQLGIDFQINDNDDGGERDQLLTWYSSGPNNNPSTYGTVQLGALPGGDIPVTGVSISPDSANLTVGGTQQLVATVTPSNATNKGHSWSTSDSSVATVSESGLVSAAGAGTATITVTTAQGGFSDSITVTVNPQTDPEALASIFGGVATGNGNEYASDWFGIFVSAEQYGNWIWHEGLGWLYTGLAEDDSMLWLWSKDLWGWIYTEADLFPFFYIVESDTWSWFTLLDGEGYRFDYYQNEWLPIVLKHPYLYFSAEDIPVIRERMEDPEFQPRRQRLMSRANVLLTASLATDPRGVLGNSGLLAFAYIVTGDERYAQRAIEQTLASAAASHSPQDPGQWTNNAVNTFNRGADLNSAERALAAALVYDWCYDVMTETQRATIRTALLEKAIQPYLHTLDPNLTPNWYTEHPVNNWRGVCHGGNTVAALALYFESPLAREAAYYGTMHVPLALSEHLLIDSGGHEGVTYNNYGIEFSLLAITALQRFFGGMEDILLEMADDRLGAYWESYMHAPDLGMFNFGRQNPGWNQGLWSQTNASEGGPMSLRGAIFDALVPGGDELLRWAADNGAQRPYWNAGSPFYFLWRRSSPSLYQSPKPALQEAVLFRGSGHAVLQSSGLYVGFSGGAVHNVGDAGSLIIVAHQNGQGGERLLHLPAFAQSGSQYQSTILVNGTGQTTGGPPPRAEYLRFGSGEGFHYLASNIRPLYTSGPLNYAVRHLVMVRGKYIVLLDELSASTAASFQARFQTLHPVSIVDEGATIQGGSYRLHVRSAGFDEFTFDQGNGIENLRYLSLTRNNTQHATLLTVLYPVRSIGGGTPVVEVDGGTVTITEGGETDVLVFSVNGGRWWLNEVNGESAVNIPSGQNRTVIPYRDGRDDPQEVPSWILKTVR